jgi:hypothetical protein
VLGDGGPRLGDANSGTADRCTHRWGVAAEPTPDIERGDQDADDATMGEHLMNVDVIVTRLFSLQGLYLLGIRVDPDLGEGSSSGREAPRWSSIFRICRFISV